MPSHQTDELLLAETAAAAGTTSERGQALLEILHRMLGFDGAWLALADPSGPGYHFLASIDVDASVVRISSGPVMAGDVEAIGTAPACPPLSPLYQPHAGQELQAWSKCLMRSEIHEALALTLFVPTGRHVGYLALLFEGPQPPSAATRRQLERLAPVIAHGIDRCVRWTSLPGWPEGPPPEWCFLPTATARPSRACRPTSYWPLTPPSSAQHVNVLMRGRSAPLLHVPLAGGRRPRPRWAPAHHCPVGARGRTAGVGRRRPPLTGAGPSRINSAGAGGGGSSGEGVLQPGHRSHARPGPADRGRPPGARPQQARGDDTNAGRGSRRTRGTLRSARAAAVNPLERHLAAPVDRLVQIVPPSIENALVFTKRSACRRERYFGTAVAMMTACSISGPLS